LKEYLTVSSFAFHKDSEEKMKKGKHLVLKTNVNNKQVRTLLDNGSKADLLDNSFARKSGIATFKLEQPIPLHLRDRKKHQTLMKAVLVNLQIGDHIEQALFYLTDLAGYKLILGDGWLQEHNPSID